MSEHKRTLKLSALPWTLENADMLEAKGLLRFFKPTEKVLNHRETYNLADEIYSSEPEYGPHKLICCGLLTDKVRLGVHPDREEIFLPNLGDEVKPCYYVVSFLTEQQIREKDAAGTLSADDFVALRMFPNERGADMFTVQPGVVHCEVTPPAEGDVPYIYVTESKDLPLTWIDLVNHAIEIG